MRVITGIARGKRLLSPDGFDVRPTSDKVKESVFSAIQFSIEGANVLDLFAGSGQLGIEALSRGAKSAAFVDKSSASINIVKRNLVVTDFLNQATVTNCEYSLFLAKTNEQFNIAFLDPPYKSGVLIDALQKTERVMANNGIIVCEHPLGVEMPSEVGRFYLHKGYKYGKVFVTIYRAKELDQ